jgi:hypothetical protein
LVGFTPLNGVSAHCCIVGPEQTTCSGDPSVSCAAPRTGYSCSAGATSFTKTCMRDASVPCGTTVGYSCTGTDIPSQSDPSITCGTPAINDGKTAYCCSA